MRASARSTTGVAEAPLAGNGLRAKRLTVDRLPSPIGDLHIVCTADRLCAIDFDGEEARLHALLARRFGAVELVAQADPLGVTSALAAYLRGDLNALDALPAEGGGTAYQVRVWQLLRTIPTGQTRSYGALAAQLGATHARAVGHANSLNPIAIVVPCHRVIGAGAALTGYAGGLFRKQWLLDHEARHTGRALMLTLPPDISRSSYASRA